MATAGDWKRRRVLVTGGTGFIGANLVRRLLAEGAEVFVMARHVAGARRFEGIENKVVLIRGDMACSSDVEAVVSRSRPSVIFHLATARQAEDQKNFKDFVSVNILGAQHLVSTARKAGVEIMVCAGSGLEYGPGSGPHGETDRLEPNTFHGLTKAAATLFFQSQAHQAQPAVVVLRLFHVYGPWESEKRLIPAAMRAALNGDRLPLTSREIRRDCVYVDDVIEAFLMAAERRDLNGEIFNIASGRQWSNEEIVAATGRIAGKPLDVEVGGYAPHSTDTACRVANIEKARDMLGWQPRTDLESGLRASFEWMSRRASGIKAI